MSATAIDVRTVAPRDRHPLIFGEFHALQPGETLVLVNDHDPRPLYHQMQAVAPDTFTWSYLESGPEVWRVAIAKTRPSTAQAPAASGSCCSGGSCG